MRQSTAGRPAGSGSALSAQSDARILVVEDEQAIRELLARTLRLSGFVVRTASSHAAALAVLDEFRPELAVLDVLLPDGSGLDLCQTMRGVDPDVAIVFVTARDTVPDRLNGFALGGDDYVTKPFSVAELVARVNAVLRRREPSPGAELLRAGDLEMHDDAHVVVRGERVLDLSPTEYRLLRYLLRNQGRVLSKEQILGQVWQHDYFGDAGVVEKFISQLRRKVDQDAAPLIHTVRGFGYVLRTPE